MQMISAHADSPLQIPNNNELNTESKSFRPIESEPVIDTLMNKLQTTSQKALLILGTVTLSCSIIYLFYSTYRSYTLIKTPLTGKVLLHLSFTSIKAPTFAIPTIVGVGMIVGTRFMTATDSFNTIFDKLKNTPIHKWPSFLQIIWVCGELSQGPEDQTRLNELHRLLIDHELPPHIYTDFRLKISKATTRAEKVTILNDLKETLYRFAAANLLSNFQDLAQNPKSNLNLLRLYKDAPQYTKAEVADIIKYATNLKYHNCDQLAIDLKDKSTAKDAFNSMYEQLTEEYKNISLIDQIMPGAAEDFKNMLTEGRGAVLSQIDNARQDVMKAVNTQVENVINATTTRADPFMKNFNARMDQVTNPDQAKKRAIEEITSCDAKDVEDVLYCNAIILTQSEIKEINQKPRSKETITKIINESSKTHIGTRVQKTITDVQDIGTRVQKTITDVQDGIYTFTAQETGILLDIDDVGNDELDKWNAIIKKINALEEKTPSTTPSNPDAAKEKENLERMTNKCVAKIKEIIKTTGTLEAKKSQITEAAKELFKCDKRLSIYGIPLVSQVNNKPPSWLASLLSRLWNLLVR